METNTYSSRDIELRSEEANDILNTPPPKLLRISNMVIFFIALILLFLSFTVSVPIYSKIPVHLQSLSRKGKVQEGEAVLDYLAVKPVSSQKVYRGQIIGSIQPVAIAEVKKLDALMTGKEPVTSEKLRGINFTGLGKLENDYAAYMSGKITMPELSAGYRQWKKEHLIISGEKGKLYMEISRGGTARYRIYAEHTQGRYMITEMSQENLGQLKDKKLFLTVISPKIVKNKRAGIVYLNEKYDKNRNIFEVVFEVENSDLLSYSSSVDGHISVLLKEERFIDLLLPFLKK